MRTFLLVLLSIIVVLTIYRRVIEPFKEGLSQTRKPYNDTPRKQGGWNFGRKKEKRINTSDTQEADFKELE